jgi:hypothetical protein
MRVVTVPVKSAVKSKINWTQAVGVLTSVLVLFGLDLDLQTQAELVAGIQGIVAVVTWIQKTFYTTTVTPSSVKKV